MADTGSSIEITGEVTFDQARIQRSVQQAAQAVQREFDRATRTLTGTSTAADQTASSFENVGRSVNNAGKQFRSAGVEINSLEKGLITTALAANQLGRTLSRMITRPILNNIREGITAVAGLEESINLTNITFQEGSDDVVEWAQNLDRSFGLTQRGALDARNNFALLFSELGLGFQRSADLSQRLVERIGDIASARNVPVEEVSRRITSGLVGETEAVRRLGIILDESIIKREAVRQGIVKQGQELDAETKIEIRAQQILAQTNNILGDAANTSDTYAGTLRQLQPAIDEFRRSLAESLVPILTVVNNLVLRTIEVFNNLPGPVRTAIAVTALLAATVGPLLIVLSQLAVGVLAVQGIMGTMAAATGGAISGIAGITGAFSGLFSSIGAILPVALRFVGIIGVVVSVLIAVFQRSEEAREAASGLFDAIGNLASSFGDLAQRVLPIVVSLLKFVVEQLAEATAPGIAVGIRALTDIFNTLAGVLDGIVFIIDKIIEGLNRIPFVNIPGIGQAETQTRSLGDAFDHLRDQVANLAPIAEFSLSKINDLLQEVIDSQEKLIAAQQKVRAAQEALARGTQAITDAQQRVRDAIERVNTAEERLTEARERLGDITADIVRLEQERQILLQDTERDVRELVEAEDDLARINLRLVDLDRERLDILQQIEELNTPASADELAAADRRITRATIALNRAKRAELELLQSLNEEQRESVDLSGLSLDQLRVRLADARAAAAAQRATKAQVKDKKSEAEIQEDIISSRLDVVEAEERLKSLQEDRLRLDRRVIDNQDTIARLSTRLNGLELTKRQLIRDQGDAQRALNSLKAGETARAAELERIEGRITQARKDQLTATKNIEIATKGVLKANQDVLAEQRNVETVTGRIRNLELQVRDAKIRQREQSAQILGDEREINRLLNDRLGINSRLLGQSGTIVQNTLIQSLIQDPAFTEAIFRQLVPIGPGTATTNANLVADLILNKPNKLRDILRQLGVSGFAEGGLITHPMVARIGEGFKHEMVLPMSKPNRVWELLSQNLPKYPGALRAAQAAVAVPESPSLGLPKVVSSSHRVVNRHDGPSTYGQIEELLTLLRETKFENKIEAPINITTDQVDEELLVKKISRRVERNVITKLSRR